MPTFENLLKEKNDRLNDIPLKLLTVVEKQQKEILNNIISELSTLTTVDGQIKINAENIRKINQISEELKTVFLNDEYLAAVKEFSKEFVTQSALNDKLIKSGFGEIDKPLASKVYIDNARKNAVLALTGETGFITPLKGILESAVVNGASVKETISAIGLFVEGNGDTDGRFLKYAKQIANDSFAIADRSYTSIISDSLEAEWFYYAGSEVSGTRCFCEQRVDKYFHYKQIESWGNGDLLGDCDLGGKWAGMIPGTNSKTIYSYLGGYNCLHSLMPVSESIVPEEDIQRARNLGFIN